MDFALVFVLWNVINRSSIVRANLNFIINMLNNLQPFDKICNIRSVTETYDINGEPEESETPIYT